jgi:hypothetical protein
LRAGLGADIVRPLSTGGGCFVILSPAGFGSAGSPAGVPGTLYMCERATAAANDESPSCEGYWGVAKW